MKIHEQLEEEIATFTQKEACIVFSTGFFVNQGVLATLLEGDDYILCDRENHASILDGCRFSAAKTGGRATKSTAKSTAKKASNTAKSASTTAKKATGTAKKTARTAKSAAKRPFASRAVSPA